MVVIKRFSIAFAMMIVAIGAMTGCDSPISGTIVGKHVGRGGLYEVHVKGSGVDKWQAVTQGAYKACRVGDDYPGCEVK